MRYVEIIASHYKIFYHGTTENRVKSILRHGLKKVQDFKRRYDESSTVKSLNNAYITESLFEALDYAYGASNDKNDMSSPVIVVVKVDMTDDQILVDEDNIVKLDEFLIKNYFPLIKSIKEITIDECVRVSINFFKENNVYNKEIIDKYKKALCQYIKYKYRLYKGIIFNPHNGRKFIRIMMDMFTNLMVVSKDYQNKIFSKLCKHEISFIGKTYIVAIYKILDNNIFTRIYGNKKYDKVLTHKISQMMLSKKKNQRFLSPPPRVK